MNYTKSYLIKVNLLVLILTMVLLAIIPVSYTVVLSFLMTYILVYVVGFNMFHRYWAHKQFILTKPFQIIFGYLGLFTMAGDALTIARTHRYHHKHADTDKDLHSPIHGRFHSFIGWMLEDSTPNIPLSTVRDLLTPEYDYLKVYLKHQIKLIWGSIFLIGILSPEILLGVTAGMCFSFLLEMLANTFNHSIKTKSASNNMIYAFLTFNAPHLDHHKNPNISENDPGMPMLDLFAKLKILSYR
jgi:stearoyl-CoA desaturase (delta-9 desaturase)